MTKLRSFEKPTGFQDLPPQLTRKRRKIEEQIRQTFERWGYEEVVTPTLEFYDTVGKASAIPEQKMFKCMDHQGNTLVLRPDQTAPIARMMASVLKNEPLPQRLSYHGSVFRAQENEAGRNAEFYQSGVELIGQSSTEADAEVIALAVEALKSSRIESFQLAIGHVALLDGLIRERVEKEEDILRLKECLGQRNMVGFRHELRQLPISEKAKQELETIFCLRHEQAPLVQISQMTSSSQVLTAMDQIIETWNHLQAYGITSHLVLDFSLIGSIDYYTGVYFEGYSSNLGFSLLSGGRYDHLLASFGRPLPATGFALYMHRVMEASDLQVDQPQSVVLCYTPEKHEQAIKKAMMLRKQGQAVVLHRLDDSEDMGELTACFDQVIWCTDEEE